MNFEKRMKKRGNQKLNKFAKNPYRVPWFKRIPMWVKIATPSLLTATAAAVLVITFMPTLNKGTTNANLSGASFYSYHQGEASNKNNPTDYVPGSAASSYAPEASSQEQMTSIPSWDSLSMPEKYNAIKYQEEQYFVCVSSSGGYAMVDSDTSLIKLADSLAVQRDYYGQGNYQDTATIYKAKFISEDAFILAKFNGDNKYYAYHNPYHTYATISDIYSELSFASEATLINVQLNNELSHDSHTYSGFDADVIKSTLFGDQTIVNETSELQKTLNYRAGNNISIVVAFGNVGGAYFAIQIYESGYMEFGGANNVYNTGTAKYQSLLNYLNNL